MSNYRHSRYDDETDLLSARLAAHRVAPKSPTEALQPEAVPPPPARSRAARHPLIVFLNFFLTTIIVAAIGVGAAFFFGKMRFESEGALDQAHTVTIERGTDVAGIADMLQRSGAISSKWLFVAGFWLSGEQANLKAGEYLIPARASMSAVERTRRLCSTSCESSSYTHASWLERSRPRFSVEPKSIFPRGTRRS